MQVPTTAVSEELILGFCRDRFGEHLHDKRVRSLAYGALGVMHADELSVAGVGRGIARARGTSPKHGIKQVDRLLSNEGVPLEACFSGWIPWLIGDRDAVTVALDWTDHAQDGQQRHDRRNRKSLLGPCPAIDIARIARALEEIAHLH